MADHDLWNALRADLLADAPKISAHIFVHMAKDLPFLSRRLIYGPIISNLVELNSPLLPKIGDNINLIKTNLESRHNDFFVENFESRCSEIALNVKNDISMLFDQLQSIKSVLDNNAPFDRALVQDFIHTYDPLAKKLGLESIRNRMKDISFIVLNPEVYEPIRTSAKDREKYIAETIPTLKQLTASLYIEGEITGRTKHLYSIHEKMSRSNIQSLSEIYDLYGFRIIVENEDDCYRIFSALNKKYRFFENRINFLLQSRKIAHY